MKIPMWNFCSLKHLSNIETCQAGSGTESGIRETLKSKKLAKLKKNVKILRETEKIENIITQFAIDADFIVIGVDEVSNASDQGTIKELFIADLLIRGTSKENKLIIEDIITNVENSGGEVEIMSSENIAGQQLVDLGSIVGILRYKPQWKKMTTDIIYIDENSEIPLSGIDFIGIIDRGTNAVSYTHLTLPTTPYV